MMKVIEDLDEPDTESDFAPVAEMVEPPPDPRIDSRSVTTPHAVEIPLVSQEDDHLWAKSSEAAFREQSFRVYFDGPYATVADPQLRFALAIAASCRPVLNPHLVPEGAKQRKSDMRAMARAVGRQRPALEQPSTPNQPDA